MIAFLDLETDGLEEDASILEVGIVVTDKDLNSIAIFRELVQPVGFPGPGLVKPGIDPFVLEMHTKNSLWTDLERYGRRRHEVEDDLCLRVAAVLGDQVGKVPVAGNSVGWDRAMLKRHMPRLNALFHRHVIDLTSFNRAAERWAKTVYANRPRSGSEAGGAHRALGDALDSLELCRHYRDNLFVARDGSE
jgi:oligoribonuclease